jgi:hypothetical protein
MSNSFSATIGRTAKYLLIALALFYACDWAFFALRLSRRTAMGTVTVDRYLKTPLKGSKEEYDFLGTEDAACSRSLFPQYAAGAWNPPCWWLERHKTRWQ